jgi:predicted transcriptional regulator
MPKEHSELKKKILEEMTVDYSNNLEKNFDTAKQFIRVTRDGTVELNVTDQVGSKEQILLYLIGKMYAKEAGLATADDASNSELIDQLGMPIGSLLPSLKELRDDNKVRQVKHDNKVHHSIPASRIEETLTTIQRKLAKRTGA